MSPEASERTLHGIQTVLAVIALGANDQHDKKKCIESLKLFSGAEIPQYNRTAFTQLSGEGDRPIVTGPHHIRHSLSLMHWHSP